MDGFNERRGDSPGRRATDVERETQLALQARELELLHDELDELRKEVNALKADREKALRWGISVLGAAVIGMGGWIFSLFASNLPKGH
jgi:hypothetical protein